MNRDDPTARCTRCGAPVDTADWHPAVLERDDDEVRAFCSPACRDRWKRSRDGPVPERA